MVEISTGEKLVVTHCKLDYINCDHYVDVDVDVDFDVDKEEDNWDAMSSVSLSDFKLGL